jgi:ABC-type phosphate/phosphonate transport system substrate-binding protein
MTSGKDTIVLGAVAYDPKVVTIWDGFKQYFAERGLGFDYVLYSNYERQVEGHFAGHFDVAWNSPLAWIEAERVSAQRGRAAEAIAMRDTDQDLTSLVVVRADSEVGEVRDLAGKTVAVGAADSPQATLIPLLHLAQAGLEPGRDFEVQRHDLLVGKHGDHIGGEREAVQALLDGRADAACMIDGNHLAFAREGTIPAGATRVLAQTGKYDHCNFTVLDGAPAELVGRFREELLAMSYDDPKVRPLLDLEGLKEWRPGRVSGYRLLNDAVDRFETLGPWLATMRAG